mmetsp:Transcript_53057/g.147185  ORF Transcript_53057/g.147185 Transcript_53057/m.147185 type:complete len:276 (-) Transcript_53057:913-1740(-)
MSNFDPQPIRGAFVSELNEDGEYGDMYGDKAKRSPMYTKHANPVELQTRNAGGGGYMQGESPYANSAMGNYDHRGGHRGGSEMGQGMGRSEEEMDKTAPEVMSDSWLQIEVNKINIFWILVSTGYMVSWTSIGSLIAYFKARQGARFYVKLYCCFYLPGLPVSLLQQKYDEKLDKMFGSANSFFDPRRAEYDGDDFVVIIHALRARHGLNRRCAERYIIMHDPDWFVLVALPWYGKHALLDVSSLEHGLHADWVPYTRDLHGGHPIHSWAQQPCF